MRINTWTLIGSALVVAVPACTTDYRDYGRNAETFATSSTTSSSGLGGGDAGRGDAGGGGAAGTGGLGSIPIYTRCADVRADAPSGVYSIQPEEAAEPFSVYCDTNGPEAGWALLFNSVGSAEGETTPFWRIVYDDRLAPKGTPSPSENFYLGALYIYGKEYLDEVVDINNQAVVVLRAEVSGFDPITMRFQGATRADNHRNEDDLSNGAFQSVFDAQLNSGWSSPDYDGDPLPADDPAKGGNCAGHYAGVTQHYEACWVYNLGADADLPFEDEGWGPHMQAATAQSLTIATDGSGYTRVNRIARWVRW